MDTTQIKAALYDIAADWNSGRNESVRDVLWQYYSECNPVTDVHVREGELALEPYFQVLSPEAGEALFDLLTELCIAYQSAAFWDGFRLGLRLQEELQ